MPGYVTHRRVWLFWLLIMLTVSCAHRHPPFPDLTPAADATIVLDTTVPQWRKICVERTFGDHDELASYDCLTAGELRAIVRQRIAAND